MTIIFALAGGSWIFLGVIVLFLVGVMIGYYTRSGLGISATPSDGRGEAPGAARDNTVATDDGARETISVRGTR